MAGEMAQLVKCLSHKQEDLSMFPSTHIRSWGGAMGLEFQSWGGRDIVALGIHSLPNLWSHQETLSQRQEADG